MYRVEMGNHGAPDIKPGYPSTAERLGPAWVVIYNQALGETTWVRGVDIAQRYAVELDLAPKTILNMLRDAATHRVIERRYRQFAHRRYAWYRRSAKTR